MAPKTVPPPSLPPAPPPRGKTLTPRSPPGDRSLRFGGRPTSGEDSSSALSLGPSLPASGREGAPKRQLRAPPPAPRGVRESPNGRVGPAGGRGGAAAPAGGRGGEGGGLPGAGPEGGAASRSFSVATRRPLRPAPAVPQRTAAQPIAEVCRWNKSMVRLAVKAGTEWKRPRYASTSR